MKSDYLKNEKAFNEIATYANYGIIDIDKGRFDGIYGVTKIDEMRKYSDSMDDSILTVLYTLDYGSISIDENGSVKFLKKSMGGREEGIIKLNGEKTSSIIELVPVKDDWYTYTLLTP